MGAPLKLLACLAICGIGAATAAAGVAGAARAAIAKATAEASGNSASASPPARYQAYSARSSIPAAASSSLPSKAAEGADASSGMRSASAKAQKSPPDVEAPEPPQQPETDGWEARFAWGLYHSKVACLAGERTIGSWALDKQGSRAGVPQLMLKAEELLERSCTEAPQDRQRTKVAEHALRLYYHAKWLAERNHAKAAEWRYREAYRLARQTRRNTLAAHALGRLGYFLMHWGRIEEAREALQESRRTSSKSNPLAPYLLGLLDRQDSGLDVDRLREAEEMIIDAGEQPSEDLEAERQQLIEVIGFWRKSEASPSNCVATTDAAHLTICLFGHIFLRMRQAFGGDG